MAMDFFLVFSCAHTTQKGSFNGRLPVSEGQETPDDLTSTCMTFLLAQKGLLCDIAAVPVLYPSFLSLRRLFIFVFVRLRTDPCGRI